MSEEKKNDTQPEQDYKALYLRAAADYQNLQREMTRKQAEWTQYANEKLIHDLLPVIVHFKEALKYIPEDQEKADWVIGIKQIKKQLDDFMLQVGLEEIKAIGEEFNPELHEAVGKEEVEGEKPDKIVKEIQGGYKLNNKVIQPSKVIINQK